MIIKTEPEKLTEQDYFDILNELRDKWKLTSFEVDAVYLKYCLGKETGEVADILYNEYFPRKITKQTNKVKNVDKHFLKDNVVGFIQDMFDAIQKRYDQKNEVAILTLEERMKILSGIARGEIKEPGNPKYNSLYRKESDNKTRIQAINVLNDFDLKSKDLNSNLEFTIQIVGEPLADNSGNRFKSGRINFAQGEKEAKVNPENLSLDGIEDVM